MSLPLAKARPKLRETAVRRGFRVLAKAVFLQHNFKWVSVCITTKFAEKQIGVTERGFLVEGLQPFLGSSVSIIFQH